MYKGMWSDCPIAIIERKAWASSSSLLNNSGSTVTEPPSGAYTAFIVLNEDFDTYTRTRGAFAPDFAAGKPTHAASQGCEYGPPSPKWRTSPARGFRMVPMGGQAVTIIFSSITETVCDFPEPCTPHTKAENGAFCERNHQWSVWKIQVSCRYQFCHCHLRLVQPHSITMHWSRSRNSTRSPPQNLVALAEESSHDHQPHLVELGMR